MKQSAVGVHDSNNDTCPFFEKLPAELRIRIYEFALGCRSIHIEDHGILDPANANIYPPPALEHKIVATVCSCSHDSEESVYELSKSNNVPHELFATADTIDYGAASQSPHFLGDYHDRHKLCFQIQDSFARGIYADDFGTVYRDKCEVAKPPCVAEGVCEHYQEVLAKYGRPTDGGLDRMYPQARLGLSLLLVCKQIYAEARLVPFYANVFCFIGGSKAVKTFPKKSLSKQQIAKIKAVRLLGEEDPIRAIRRVVRALPGVRYLDMHTAGAEFEIADGEEVPSFAGVRVIVGSDEDHCEMERTERRDLAQKLEDLLTESKMKGLEEEDEQDDVESVSSREEVRNEFELWREEARRGTLVDRRQAE